MIGTTWTEASACTGANCVQTRWTKAAASAGGNCVEVRIIPAPKDKP